MAPKDQSSPGRPTPKLRFPEFAEPWDTAPLNELAALVSDRVGASDCIPYTVTSGVGLVSQDEKFGRTIAGKSISNYIRLRKHDFAYNKSATKAYPEGYIARYLDDLRAAVPNSIFTCFRPDPQKIDPAYLDFLFTNNLHGRWLRNFLTVGARAHGSLNVNDDHLMALPVPLPGGASSLAEQSKIAACLTSLDALIDAEGLKLDALKAYKKGLMRQLFPFPGESRPRVRFPEFRGTGDWEEWPLGEIVHIVSGQVDPTKAPYCDLPHVGGENIEPQTGTLVNLRSAREDGVISGKYTFDERHVLYAKIRPALNKVASPNFAGVCSADIYPLRPAESSLRRDFLVFLLRSESFVQYATKHSERSKIPKVNREALVVYRAPLPQRAEQQRVAACLGSLDTLISSVSQKLDGLRTHKKGLLQQLFPAPEVD